MLNTNTNGGGAAQRRGKLAGGRVNILKQGAMTKIIIWIGVFSKLLIKLKVYVPAVVDGGTVIIQPA